MYTITATPLMPGVTLGQTSWATSLTVTSSDPELYPVEVFVYHIEEPNDPATRLHYECVATPSQLLEYPAIEPALIESGSDAIQPYLRSSELTLVGRNPTMIQELVEDISRQIMILRANLDALAEMGDTTTITV